MIGAINPARTPIRMFGHPNPPFAIRKQDATTPRTELPSVFPTSTSPMPHAHREEVINTAGAAFWATQTLRQEEEKRNPRF